MRETWSSRTPSSSCRRRTPNSTRIMATANGISWSSSTKSYRDGGITKISKVLPSDTLARRKLIEDQNTILELSGRVQELQNEVNCMNDSKDFHDAESVRSGNSHVTSQPMSFPPHPIPEGLLRPSFVSPRRKEGPPCIWNTHGFPGNFFENPHASSSAPYPQELNPWRRPLRSRFIFLQRRKVKDQNKIEIWDASLDRGVYLFTILCGSDAMDQRSGVGWFSGWIEIFVIYSWYVNAEFWSTWCEDCFIQNENQSGGTRSPKRGPLPSRQTDCLLDLRSPTGHWEPWFCRKLHRPIHYCSSKWRYSGIRF